MTSTAPEASSSSSSAAEKHPALDADPELLRFAGSIDDELEREAAGQDQGGAGARAAAPAAAVPLEEEIAGMFAAIAAAVGQFLPSVEATLDDGACGKLGKAIAPVLRKYGLDRHLEGFAWRIELQALMVVVPIGFAVKAAVEHDLAQYRAAAASDRAGAAGAGLGGDQAGAAAAASSSSSSPAAPKLEPLKPIS